MPFTFEDVEITITNSDDSTETFNLEAPTRDDSSRFEFGFQRLSLKQTYRDRNLVNRRGTEYYQFVCTLSYAWHRMDLRKLLTAKSIALKIPPAFGSTTDNYQSFDVRLENDDVVRNWLGGVVVGGNPDGGIGTNEEFNPIPSGEVSLRFIGTKAYEASEVLSAGNWRQTQTPTAPSGLSVDSIGVNSLTLSWDANTETDLAGYNIYYRESGVGNYTKHNASLHADESEYVLDSIDSETEYDAYVTAVNDLGLESNPSNVVTETTLSASALDNLISLSFDGVDDYVDIGTMPNLDPNLFTISMWIKTTSTAQTTLFGTANDGLTTALFVSLNLDEEGNSEINNLRVFIRDDDGTRLEASLTTPYDFTDGVWHHFTFQRTGGTTLKILIDFVDQPLTYHSIGASGNPDNFSAFQYPIFLGALNNRATPAGFTEAIMDEFQFWDKVLTEAEIRSNMNKMLTGSETDLIGYWNCEDENVSQLTDLTANNNHGTINGAVYVEDAFNFDWSLEGASETNWIQIADEPTVAFGGVTIAFWGKFASSPAEGFPVFANLASGWQMLADVSGNFANKFYGSFNYDGTDQQNSEGTNDGNQYILFDAWHHYAVSYDLSTVRFYRDGVLHSSHSKSKSQQSLTITSIFGRDTGGGVIDNGFIGKFEKLEWWNIHRTQAQIQDSMNNGLEGDESGLIGYWPFDDLNDLAVAKDASPNGYDGTINGYNYSPENHNS